MPHRRAARSAARRLRAWAAGWLSWLGRHTNIVLTVILFALVVTGIASLQGVRAKADVDALERAEESNAVALCFARSRSGPQIVRVFQALSTGVADAGERAYINSVIHEYEVGTPKRAACIERANRDRVDWRTIEQQQLALIRETDGQGGP